MIVGKGLRKALHFTSLIVPLLSTGLEMLKKSIDTSETLTPAGVGCVLPVTDCKSATSVSYIYRLPVMPYEGIRKAAGRYYFVPII